MPANSKTRAFVDADQKDPKNAVERVTDDADDRRLPGSEDSDSMTDVEKRNASWLEKDKAVKARIGRFQRNMTRQFDQERANTQAELQRMRRENEDLRKSLGNGRQAAGNADEAAHEREMADLQSQMEAATEAGDSKKVAQLARTMARKEAEFVNAKTAAALGQSQREAERGTERQQEQAPTQHSRKPTATGLKFVKAQQDWWDDPEYAAERGAANAIHAVMVEQEDSDPDSEEHYAELAKRLKGKFPKLEIGGVKLKAADAADDDGDEGEEEDERPAARARRAPVQNFHDRGDAGPVRRRNGAVQLTEADYATMRAVNMDPNNDKHLAQFAKSKVETAAAMRNAR